VSLPAFLADLRARDIQVWVDGNRLRCAAPGDALTPELRDLLQQRKSEILEFLRSAEALAGHPRAIVPLQANGARTPVFAVPGHNGDVFCYHALARHLDADQPFFGLQPPGLDGGSRPLRRVEELAAYFAAQIRAFRADGPCIVAGYCAGGVTAFELARQLLREGTPVSFLALFGAPYPATYRRLKLLRARLDHRMELLVRHARALSSLPPGEWWPHIAATLRERRAQAAAAAPASDGAVLALRAAVERATVAAARRYTPGRFPGRVGLFLPCDAWAHSGKEPLRWRSLAQDAEVYCGPDDGCNGDNMLREPFAPAFAELFMRCRDEMVEATARRRAP
jgi:thioesterase domain-containing protein